MRNLRWFTALAALVLASCGGSNCGTSFANTCGNSGAHFRGHGTADIGCRLDSFRRLVDGHLSALAKDANNNAVSGVTVTFSSTAGSLVVTQAVTDASGVGESDAGRERRRGSTSITVTAAAGTISANTAVGVVNTQQTISLITSLPQIPSDGSKSANSRHWCATRTIRGNGRYVNFMSTSGALTITQGVTNCHGNRAGDVELGY